MVLLDYDFGKEQKSSLIAELKNRQSEAKVLMVTAGMSDAVTLHIIEAGASGVFLKHSSLDQLMAAIHRVANGEIWLDSGAIRSLVAGRSSGAKRFERTQSLTSRQSEVLGGILDGLTNKEIAGNLKVSVSSVKAVIHELFHKAGVRTRSQLGRVNTIVGPRR